MVINIQGYCFLESQYFVGNFLLPSKYLVFFIGVKKSTNQIVRDLFLIDCYHEFYFTICLCCHDHIYNTIYLFVVYQYVLLFCEDHYINRIVCMSLS